MAVAGGLLLASTMPGLAGQVDAGAAVNALQHKARIDRVAVIDALRVKDRVVAVGERGQVFVTTDPGGGTWSPRQSGVEKTLTSVTYLGDSTLVALGHAGSILYSKDLGDTWASSAPGRTGEALMAACLTRDGSVLAVGAYASFLKSSDKGRTWAAKQILGADVDTHFYGLASSRETLVLVGEAGLIAVSADQGDAWQVVKSPYHGSLFGVAATAGDVLVAFGMRGTVLVSRDGGRQWTALQSGTKSPFFSATLLKNGGLALGGKDGVLAQISPSGELLDVRAAEDRRSVSKIVELDENEWLLLGEAGVRRVRWNELKK